MSARQDSSSNDAWLEQIKQLHEQDKIRRQGERKPAAQSQSRRERAADLMRQSKALELLRQVQKALLNGAGVIRVFEEPKEYDRAMVLMWQGPISAARKPTEGGADVSYIIVSVKADKV